MTRRSHPVWHLCALLLVACMALLGGCAEERIHDQSTQALAAGDYEQAVHALEDGLRQHPDSTLLRTALIRTRADAASHLVASAEDLRATGRLDEAEAVLHRAAALDPRNDRIGTLLDGLDTRRRQDQAEAEARQLLANHQGDAALQVIELALTDDPRHEGLVALRRRIELDQREHEAKASQAMLSETRPISLDFRDASLRTVLDVVSRNSGINFVLDKDIRPDTRITVYLRQARVEDALDLIVGTNQLAKKVMDAHTIVVYPNTPEKQREYEEQVVRVFYLTHAEAKGAAAFLKSMLKIHDPFVDERSNMLSLRDSEENVRMAERLLALYDAADPEVEFDVEVLEVNATRLTQLGVQYPTSVSLSPLPPGGSSNLTLGNVRNLTRDNIALGLSGVVVNLKRQIGDYTTLANPKIRVTNRGKAKVMIGDKIPVITTTTAQAGFVSDSVNYLDVGIKLEVEPTVYVDDEVSIKIGLEVSSLGNSVTTASGTVAYQIGTRNADTVLRLRDGQTQLLAGLISHDERTDAARIPGIGDLPVLGRLFSSQTDNNDRTELVLAITPHVLRNIRLPDAAEAELWVGTEAAPHLRPAGGLPGLAERADAAASAPAGTAAAPAAPGTAAFAMAPPPASAPPGSPASPSATAPAAVPQFGWSGPSEAHVGETVSLKLSLDSATTLRGVPMEFSFPTDRLQFVDIDEGSYFRRDGVPTSFSHSGGGKDGRLNAGVLRNQASGAQGHADLVTLRFKVLKPGPAEVRLVSAQPIGLGAPVPAPQLPASWTLQAQ